MSDINFRDDLKLEIINSKETKQVVEKRNESM